MKWYGNVEGAGKIGFIDLWRNYLLTKVKRDLSEKHLVSTENLYSDGNAVMSGKDLISYFYTIDGFPPQVSVDFKGDIRREARQGVRVSFIETYDPTTIEWNSPKMRSRLSTWKSAEEESDEVTAYNYYHTMSSSNNIARRKESLVYLVDAEIERKRKLFRFRLVMIISGRRGENFDKSIVAIKDYCKRTGISANRIVDDIESYLGYFSPFANELDSKVLSNVGSNTIPDEQIARFSTYSQGKIGKDGIVFGTDIFSGFPVYKLIKKEDTDAENILIAGGTGSGKSFFLKALLLQILGMKEFNGTINDIEGFEYIPMAGFIANHDKVVILNMAEGEGCYYDPFEIRLTGVDSLDRDMFNLAKSFTSSYFNVLIGEQLKQDVWSDKIINNAISRAFTDLGVVEEDRSTWSNTLGYGLKYVYSKFKDLYKECIELEEGNEDSEELELHELYKQNPGYRDMLDKVVAKLSEYFEPLDKGGIRSDVFRNKIALSDIIDAKLVINSFGMAGKSADTVDTTQMTLSQLSAANISYIRSVFSKSRGMYNFKVWEEFQRWGSFPGSVNTIKTAITGGRKLGDVNFIITNNIKELLDDDRFAIFDNITSFAIGSIKSAGTRKRVCEQLSIPQLLPELDALVIKRGNTSSLDSDGAASIYNKAFLVQLDDSVTTISKMLLPKHLVNSDIFKTGVNLNTR